MIYPMKEVQQTSENTSRPGRLVVDGACGEKRCVRRAVSGVDE